MKHPSRVALAALVPLAMGVGLSAPAHADDTQGYLQALHGYGVIEPGETDIHSDSEALDVGRQTCQKLRGGQSARTVERQLVKSYSNPTSEDIIKEAHDHLCPDAPPLNWSS
jgi:hypothetical protein